MPEPERLWLTQQLQQMERGVSAGRTRRRKVQSCTGMNVTEVELKEAVEKRGWRLAQIGEDYVFAPGDYTIRPIL